MCCRFHRCFIQSNKGHRENLKDPKGGNKNGSQLWKVKFCYLSNNIAGLAHETPVLSTPQSSSDYISPYELPVLTQSSENDAKEIESPAAGNKSEDKTFFFFW